MRTLPGPDRLPEVSVVDAPTQPGLRRELLLVFGVSLGASAIWSILSLADKLTRQVALNQQTTSMNTSVTPDRPWLDLAYQLTGIALALVPVGIALYLLARIAPPFPQRPLVGLGVDARGLPTDARRGLLLAALIGIPGLGLYLAARALGVNTSIAAANLAGAWWTVPVLILAAAQNAALEEVLVVGYLLTRARQLGWSLPVAIGVSAALRGSYHLYQGFGGFVGNLAMGGVFALAYRRWGRVGPLVVAHTVLDVVAFVGYSLLRGKVGWL